MSVRTAGVYVQIAIGDVYMGGGGVVREGAGN